jgi:hypothetical protein
VTSTVDELRRKVAAALRRALDAHERRAFDEFAPLYDQLEREASALDALDPDVTVAIHFLDCWYDSANHDWMYYDRMGAGDWPRVATRLASDLESGVPIDAEVREQFTFTPRPGLVSRLRDLFRR